MPQSLQPDVRQPAMPDQGVALPTTGIIRVRNNHAISAHWSVKLSVTRQQQSCN